MILEACVKQKIGDESYCNLTKNEPICHISSAQYFHDVIKRFQANPLLSVTMYRRDFLLYHIYKIIKSYRIILL